MRSQTKGGLGFHDPVPGLEGPAVGSASSSSSSSEATAVSLRTLARVGRLEGWRMEVCLKLGA